jgi:hypothetical protein
VRTICDAGANFGRGRGNESVRRARHRVGLPVARAGHLARLESGRGDGT